MQDPLNVTSDWLATSHPCDFSKVERSCIRDMDIVQTRELELMLAS